MSFGKMLRKLRTDKDWTQKELGDKVNISDRVIGYYESGDRFPKDDKVLSEIADIFSVSTDYLLGRTDIPNPVQKHKPVPVIGTIKAGVPLLAEENWSEEIDLGDIKADFALRVEGDSMSWAGIHEGDIVFLNQQSVASSGDIVAVGIESEEWKATLKFYVHNNGNPILRAANPNYEEIVCDKKYRIIGKVTHVFKAAPSHADYQQIVSLKAHLEEEWLKAVEFFRSSNLDPATTQMIVLSHIKAMKAMYEGKVQ